MNLTIKPVFFKDEKLYILDQSKLPFEEVYLEIDSLETAIEAIAKLKVRGAPAIGIAAAYAFVIGLKNALLMNSKEILTISAEVKRKLEKSRPTAVNLFNALNRMESKLKSLVASGLCHEEIYRKLIEEADQIYAEDLRASQEIFRRFLELFKEVEEPLNVLTHCNTGALATSGLGTALGAIRALHETGKVKTVFATETRPLLQGSRLTVWELQKYGIDHRLIVDSAAAFLMSEGLIDLVVVGADRVARNGDTANKIGTLALAISANHFKVPFIVVCPSSTFDMSLENGKQIPIEYRGCDEINSIRGQKVSSADTNCLNPAFDITPAELITAIVSEKEVLKFKELPW